MIPAFILTFIEGLLGPKFSRFAKPLIYVAAFLLAFLAVVAVIKIHDHRVIANHEAQIDQRAKPATDQAANQRATDTIKLSNQEQEMHNAIAAQPDQPIAPSSHARACLQLRRAGKHSPACP